MPPAPQNYANHARLVPMYHFVLAAMLLINCFRAVLAVWHQVSAAAIYELLLAAALLILYFYVRHFPVTVQDRVIRLEMRLRLTDLVPDVMPRFAEFRPEQLVALRFAGDHELPALARQTLEGRFARPDDIKRAIKDWQPDHLRV